MRFFFLSASSVALHGATRESFKADRIPEPQRRKPGHRQDTGMENDSPGGRKEVEADGGDGETERDQCLTLLPESFSVEVLMFISYLNINPN